MDGSAAETIRQPRDRLRGQPQERERKATPQAARRIDCPRRGVPNQRQGWKPNGRNAVAVHDSPAATRVAKRTRCKKGPPKRGSIFIGTHDGQNARRLLRIGGIFGAELTGLVVIIDFPEVRLSGYLDHTEIVLLVRVVFTVEI
jgi:hypothetical protein